MGYEQGPRSGDQYHAALQKLRAADIQPGIRRHPAGFAVTQVNGRRLADQVPLVPQLVQGVGRMGITPAADADEHTIEPQGVVERQVGIVRHP